MLICIKAEVPLEICEIDDNNPHPKDLSKSPAVAGFFVCIDDDG
jgi:hypothetical protein